MKWYIPLNIKLRSEVATIAFVRGLQVTYVEPKELLHDRKAPSGYCYLLSSRINKPQAIDTVR